MTKEKHGNYDRERGIPDNRGQVSDSGLYVWLCDQVRQRFPDDGPSLVEACHKHGDRRYRWLLDQIEAMQTPESTQLVEEFAAKKLRIEAWQRQEQRQHDLHNFEKRLAEQPDNEWLAKKVKRIQREMAKAEERWKFSKSEG